MAEVNIDVAKEESVQAVNANVNYAVSNTAYSATASSMGTLSQKLSYIISTLIGATNATGGTTTAGTLMAKVNALLTSWTSTRAGYIDTIKSYLENATYGLNALKTAISNSGQSVSLTGVGATIYTSPSAVNLYNSAYTCVAKFVAPVAGVYNVSISVPSQTYNNISAAFFKVEDRAISGIYYDSSQHPLTYTGFLSQAKSYGLSSVGNTSVAPVNGFTDGAVYWGSLAYYLFSGGSDWSGWQGGELSKLLCKVGYVLAAVGAPKTQTFSIYCKAGELVQIIGMGGTNIAFAATLSITYQP